MGWSIEITCLTPESDVMCWRRLIKAFKRILLNQPNDKPNTSRVRAYVPTCENAYGLTPWKCRPATLFEKMHTNALSKYSSAGIRQFIMTRNSKLGKSCYFTLCSLPSSDIHEAVTLRASECTHTSHDVYVVACDNRLSFETFCENLAQRIC